MNPRRALTAALAGLAAASVVSCYPTTIRSGRPALPSSETTYWHHAFVFGLVEASGPYRLDHICPDGWSEFYSEMPAFAAILRILTVGLYAPAEVHIVCAAPAGVDVNSVAEGPLPILRVGDDVIGDAGASLLPNVIDAGPTSPVPDAATRALSR